MSGESHQVCLKCSQLIVPMTSRKAGGGLHLDDDWRVEHLSADQIMLNSRAGCPVCRFLEVAISMPLFLRQCPDLRHRSLTWTGFSATEQGPPKPNRILISIEGTQSSWHAAVVGTTRQVDDEWGLSVGSISRPPVQLQPGDDRSYPMDSPEAFSLAKSWLSICLRDHQCRSGDLDCKMPTRVINVEWGDGSQLKLEVNASPGKYAALSYCWGDANAFVTNSNNRLHHSNGFALTLLPRTLREAVMVTRRLGLKYLWIDALCILQGKDDAAHQDWEREVSRMRDVFSNASITLCATGSFDADCGIFHPSHCVVPFTTQLSSSSQPTASGFATIEANRVRHPTDFGDEPINSRAWTLQEHVLSPRMLMFTSSRMVWFCDQNTISSQNEDNIILADNSIWGNAYLFSVKSHVRRFSSATSDPSWSALVENYCSRNLTDPSDKLPAIAGLAQQYHQRTTAAGEVYIAGLWSSKIAIQMLWYCKQPQKYRGIGYPIVANTVPSEYRAPSWSWAAIDGNVEFCRYDIPGNDMFVSRRFREFNTPPTVELVFRVISAHCGLSNPRDPYGAVTSGQVIVHGPVRKAFRLSHLEDLSPVLLGINSATGEEVDIADEVLRDGPPTNTPLLNDVYCLLCLKSKRPEVMGLILEPVPDKSGVYRRVGVFFVRNASLSKAKLAWHE